MARFPTGNEESGYIPRKSILVSTFTPLGSNPIYEPSHRPINSININYIKRNIQAYLIFFIKVAKIMRTGQICIYKSNNDLADKNSGGV